MSRTPDDMQRRCPRLGGPVAFKYCRFSGSGRQPCWKIADCWWERFDVMGYLKETLSEAEFNALLGERPQPKITSIVELIEQARKRAGGGADTE
jgi:hypothetical protein